MTLNHWIKIDHIPLKMIMLDSNLLTAITSRAATLISASSKDHVMIEYHVMCLVFCMYSTLYSVQYGEIYFQNFIF